MASKLKGESGKIIGGRDVEAGLLVFVLNKNITCTLFVKKRLTLDQL